MLKLRPLLFCFLMPLALHIEAFAMKGFTFGELNIVTQSLDNKGTTFPLGQGHFRCSKVFSSPGKAHLLKIRMGGGRNGPDGNQDLSDMASASFSTVPTHRPAQEHRALFDQAMTQWLDHGYNGRQVELLRQINDRLPPQRVHWINFRFTPELMPDYNLPVDIQGLSSIRIFDGSQPLTKAFGHPIRYSERGTESDPNNLTEALTPIELSPKNWEAGYLLPWRPQGRVKPTYLWHIGIGTNVKKFEGGLLVMFSHVAKLLDLHYNRGYMKTFGSFEPVEQLDMMIVSSAKADLVPYYTKFGFKDMGDGYRTETQSIVSVDSAGNATLVKGEQPSLPDGMRLIGMKASEFLDQFYRYSDVPHISFENATQQYRLGREDLKEDPPAEARFLEANRNAKQNGEPINDTLQLGQAIKELEQLYVTYILSLNRFVENHPEVHRMDKPEHEYFKDNQAYQQLIQTHRRFSERLFQVVNGAEKSLRTNEWEYLEDGAISSLTNFPLEGSQLFKFDPAAGQFDFVLSLKEALISR